MGRRKLKNVIDSEDDEDKPPPRCDDPDIFDAEASEPESEPLGEDEYEVERILSHDYRTAERKYYYFVRWKGWKAEHDSWVAEENMGCPDLIAAYKVAKAKQSNACADSEIDDFIADDDADTQGDRVKKRGRKRHKERFDEATTSIKAEQQEAEEDDKQMNPPQPKHVGRGRKRKHPKPAAEEEQKAQQTKEEEKGKRRQVPEEREMDEGRKERQRRHKEGKQAQQEGREERSQVQEEEEEESQGQKEGGRQTRKEREEAQGREEAQAAQEEEMEDAQAMQQEEREHSQTQEEEREERQTEEREERQTQEREERQTQEREERQTQEREERQTQEREERHIDVKRGPTQKKSKRHNRGAGAKHGAAVSTKDLKRAIPKDIWRDYLGTEWMDLENMKMEEEDEPQYEPMMPLNPDKPDEVTCWVKELLDIEDNGFARGWEVESVLGVSAKAEDGTRQCFVKFVGFKSPQQILLDVVKQKAPQAFFQWYSWQNGMDSLDKCGAYWEERLRQPPSWMCRQSLAAFAAWKASKLKQFGTGKRDATTDDCNDDDGDGQEQKGQLTAWKWAPKLDDDERQMDDEEEEEEDEEFSDSNEETDDCTDDLKEEEEELRADDDVPMAGENGGR